MSFIENEKWRYATKKFDATKKISNADLEVLKEAIQLAPTSYGLQLYKVLIIENQPLKQQLRKASWNQSQIEDASHVFVFCNFKEVNRDHLDSYLVRKAEIYSLETTSLVGYADFIEGKLAERKRDEIENWTAKQTYIALAYLMNAAADLKIDSCPMEGFDSMQYNEILGLDEKGLNAAVVAAVGYRSGDDKSQYSLKVRKRNEDLFQHI